MFNTRLKKELQAREAELSVYKQMETGMDAQMLSVILDASFRITYANANFLNALGYTAERLVGRALDEIVPAYVKQLDCYRNLRAAIDTGESIVDNYRFLRQDGSLAWVRAIWYPIMGEDGELSLIRFFGTDITPAIELATENAGFIQALLRSTAVIEFDLGGHVLTANDQFLRGMGYNLAQIKGKHHSLFCDPQETASSPYKEFWATLNRGEFVASRFKRVDSSWRVVWL
jgi:methyl-accepting chemotaxis protein